MKRSEIMKRLFRLMSIFIILFIPCAASAIVINFDDIVANPNFVVISDYQGITWGTSMENSNEGETGAWAILAAGSYAIPQSSPNILVNIYGANNMWFRFPDPVNFVGAWFSQAGVNYCPEVRFRDDMGHSSAWLQVISTPQYLSADFFGSTQITVERRDNSNSNNPLWYTMDDVIYNTTSPVPEPTTMLLLGLGLMGLARVRRKMR